jgi:hypothetical protein
MEYVRKNASEPLVVFTGLYHPEEDMEEVSFLFKFIF